MSTITWPSSQLFTPRRFEFALRSNVLTSTSSLTGSVQTVEIPGARWVGSMVLDRASRANQAAREAILSQIAGRANRVSLWHFDRPTPGGTIAGSPILSATAAAGATSLAITTTAGATALAGDMFSVGGQLVQCVTDAAANGSGAMTMSIRPALRAQVASGSAVTWDKPTSTFLLADSEVYVAYDAVTGDEISLQFIEVFT